MSNTRLGSGKYFDAGSQRIVENCFVLSAILRLNPGVGLVSAGFSMNEYTDPARTLQLLQQLGDLGMNDSAFSVLHHFSKPESIASHRNYCQMLVDEGARFRTANNPRVQKRLEMVLSMYKAGGFTSGNHGVFEHLAKAAELELPTDLRPLSQQVRDV